MASTQRHDWSHAKFSDHSDPRLFCIPFSKGPWIHVCLRSFKTVVEPTEFIKKIWMSSTCLLWTHCPLPGTLRWTNNTLLSWMIIHSRGSSAYNAECITQWGSVWWISRSHEWFSKMQIYQSCSQTFSLQAREVHAHSLHQSWPRLTSLAFFNISRALDWCRSFFLPCNRPP